MKKADFILIGIVAVIVIILLIALYATGGNSGNRVQIEVDSQVVETLPLDTDAEKIIKTEKGETNTIIIKDGKVSILQADCPDKICVHHRAISRTGESIICLPHKLVVSVTNDKNTENEIDAVA